MEAMRYSGGDQARESGENGLSQLRHALTLNDHAMPAALGLDAIISAGLAYADLSAITPGRARPLRSALRSGRIFVGRSPKQSAPARSISRWSR